MQPLINFVGDLEEENHDIIEQDIQQPPQHQQPLQTQNVVNLWLKLTTL